MLEGAAPNGAAPTECRVLLGGAAPEAAANAALRATDGPAAGGMGAGRGTGGCAPGDCAGKGPGVRLAKGSDVTSAGWPGCAGRPTPANVRRPTALAAIGIAGTAGGATFAVRAGAGAAAGGMPD